ncbi:hypothetical protein ACWDTQ_22935 [Streptomyces cellulosae]|uniref:Uncharacterized protein n=1 Tax=Streptomyces cellulosae TaxID=1968 RepID=A0ABW6JMA2_STRCE
MTVASHRFTANANVLDSAAFLPPSCRSHEDSVRIDATTGRVLGYLRPGDGPVFDRFGGSAGTTVDPLCVNVTPGLDTLITTDEGEVLGMPLYAVVSGSAADPAQSHTAATMHYPMLGQHIGYVTAGKNREGLWVAGVLTDPTLTDEQRAAIAATTVRADFRRNDGEYQLVALYVVLDAVLLPGLVRRHVLTKGDLLRMLTTGRYADDPDDTMILLVNRGEPVPVSSVERARYLPTSTSTGELHRSVPAQRDHSETIPPGSMGALVIEPVS